jgi:hypothetical protein
LYVRIVERLDGALHIERKPNATTADRYKTILHVWGNPRKLQAITIDGIEA